MRSGFEKRKGFATLVLLTFFFMHDVLPDKAFAGGLSGPAARVAMCEAYFADCADKPDCEPQRLTCRKSFDFCLKTGLFPRPEMNISPAAPSCENGLAECMEPSQLPMKTHSDGSLPHSDPVPWARSADTQQNDDTSSSQNDSPGTDVNVQTDSDPGRDFLENEPFQTN